MALLNIVGFETGDTFELRTGVITGTGSIQGTVKRTGNYALRCNPATTATGFGRIAAYVASGENALGSLPTLHGRFYFRYATKPAANNEGICSYWGVAEKLTIRLDSAGKLSAWDGITQLGSTGTTVLSADTWYRIGVTCSTGTNAAWALTIDGTAELSGTRTFTSNTNNVELELGKLTNRNGQTVDFFYDDAAISDTAIPGAGAVVMAKANGNGTYTAWTGDYTPEWTESPPIVTDDAAATQYVATSTNTNAESATMENCATIGASGTINAVKAMAIVKQGATALCKIRLRSSTTDSDTTGFAPGASYVTIGKILETDPATSAAWTTSGVDAIEVGVVHAQSQVRELRCTAVFAMVDFTVSGPTAYTMDASPGSYSIGGLATLNQAARLLAAAPGSYATTGQDILFGYGRFLEAAAGSYSISGLDTLLQSTRLLNAAAGSYSVTGANSLLVAARILEAAPGSYATSGLDAILAKGYAMEVAPGSYAISGLDSLLLSTRVLDAATGSYVITGADALLVAQRTLDAGAGAYLITGADALLVAARALDAEPGSYAITGLDAVLLYTPLAPPGAFDLLAEPGVYSISGADSLLLAARLLNAEPGSYAITGNDAALLAARSLAAEPGSYAITGSDAALLAGRILAAAAGSYAITGADALLMADYVLNAGPGVYAIDGADVEFVFSGDTAGPGAGGPYVVWARRRGRR